MDKIISYLTIFAICILVIIGGNYFLTDDVGNFSMEKAKNLIPNIEEAIINKKNEITQTRDINTDMTDKKNAERLNIEGPNISFKASVKVTLNRQSIESITEQYMKEMNALNDDMFNNATSFQKGAILKKIQDKYLGKKFYWSGIVSNVKQYSDYILLTMKVKGNDYKYNVLFCQMALNEFSRIDLRNVKKKDAITVTGNYQRSDEDPWLNECKIVTDP